MTSLLGRKVSVVRLHTPSHSRKFGTLGSTVTEDFKERGKATLTIVENGNILFECGGAEILLYAANIIEAELKPVTKAQE